MELKESLAAAGLLVLEECGDLGGLVPPLVTGQAPSCLFEDGRTESLLDIDDPLLEQRHGSKSIRLEVWRKLYLKKAYGVSSFRQIRRGVKPSVISILLR
ncbi:hypothetical protein [Streptomyces sp. NPDC094437]|uniref:hypothetical protein n=1 Tax=Streptomyces sp. NPDC094437 TaxID=3366060 RepID=UPI003805FB8A